jgi:hypothetical protein
MLYPASAPLHHRFDLAKLLSQRKVFSIYPIEL